MERTSAEILTVEFTFMRNGSVRLPFIALLILPFLFVAQPLQAIDWLPIDQADLALKDHPSLPGTPAMILYRSVERNDTTGAEINYVRIKIFTEEGKRYADVRIPWEQGHYSAIDAVKGRTIHPDGTVIPFEGQILEKVLSKAKDDNIGVLDFGYGTIYYGRQVKTFALPDVTPGSIIEYQYTLHWQAMRPNMWGGGTFYVSDSEWLLQEDLPQRRAHFYLKPANPDLWKYAMRTIGLPPTAKVKQGVDDSITLDIENVPPYEEETFMPPEKETRSRAFFFYDTEDLYNADKFWKSQGKKWNSEAEGFMAKQSAAVQQVSRTVAPGDNLDTKLHKLYDYVQTFRNLTYEHGSASADNKSVDEVIAHSYGYRNELNRLFVAMARWAGADATLVRVADRNASLFHKEWPTLSQVRDELVLVREGGRELYLDPGTYGCPYGIIPWEHTASAGLKLDKNPPVFVTLPIPDAGTNQYKAAGKLNLAKDGSLSGDVELTFTGQASMDMRMRSLQKDDEQRKNMMENLLKNWLAANAQVELVKVNSWQGSAPLVAQYKVSVAGFASVVGRRLLVRGTLLPGSYGNPFTSARRNHPVVMPFNYERSEDVVIALPEGVQVDNLPSAFDNKNALAEAAATWKNENGTLHFTRRLRVVGASMGIDPTYYAAVRQYFQGVQANTNERVVLSSKAAN